MSRLIMTLMMVCATAQAWTFNWSNPVDQAGYAAGIYSVTPFPITETSETYTASSEEFTNVYDLGTLYFVDGAAADDTGDGLSLATAKKTLTAGIGLSAGTNNATVIVRGAHDEFNGVYVNGHYSLRVGLNNTQRFTIVGYGQERPTFDATNHVNPVFGGFMGWATNAYITLQRLKIVNCNRECIAAGADQDAPTANYINLIDVHCVSNTLSTTVAGNGSVYYLNADHGWISHCTFERSGGHGAKLGDGTSYLTLEWNLILENGKWDAKTSSLSRTVGIDFAADRDRSTNCVVRYNIMRGCLSHGVQFRRNHSFNFHHNEISDWGEGIGQINMSGTYPNGITLLGNSWGDIHDNKLHSIATANSNRIMLQVQSTATGQPVRIWNNLIYQTNAINVEGIYSDDDSAPDLYIYNNTVVMSNALACFRSRDPATTTAVHVLRNNIFVQDGTGSCITRVTYTTPPVPLRDHNIYWHPRGASNYWTETGTGEQVTNPMLNAAYALLIGSPAIGAASNMSAVYSDDLAGFARGEAWDVGAFEYTPAPIRRPLAIRRFR